MIAILLLHRSSYMTSLCMVFLFLASLNGDDDDDDDDDSVVVLVLAILYLEAFWDWTPTLCRG